MNHEINGVPVLRDGEPTPEGERLMCAVYEAVTGECWHDGHETCLKCEAVYPLNRNPPLLTSLDAVMPLLRVYFGTDDYDGFESFFEYISGLHGSTLDSVNDGTIGLDEFGIELLTLEAHTILQALASVLKCECSECKGGGEVDTSGFGDIVNCDCNEGKTTVLKKWEVGL